MASTGRNIADYCVLVAPDQFNLSSTIRYTAHGYQWEALLRYPGPFWRGVLYRLSHPRANRVTFSAPHNTQGAVYGCGTAGAVHQHTRHSLSGLVWCGHPGGGRLESCIFRRFAAEPGKSPGTLASSSPRCVRAVARAPFLTHPALCFGTVLQELARQAKGVSLLIHEATFEDALASHALAKRHSTVGEALQAAAEMAAYRVILTHFSQRYPFPPGVESTAPYQEHYAVAFDGMRVNLRALPLLPRMLGGARAIWAGGPRDFTADQL